MHAPSLRQELSRSSETCVCVCVSSLSLVHAVRFVHACTVTSSRPLSSTRSARPHTHSLALQTLLCVCVCVSSLSLSLSRPRGPLRPRFVLFIYNFFAYILLVVYIEFSLTPLSGSILSICFHHAGG